MTPGRGLDLFNGLVASVQTGFGPFIAVYLASEAWTQRDIGAALSLGTIVSVVSQVPGGALVDWLSNKRVVGVLSCLAIALSALMLAQFPFRGPVLGAEVLHGLGSCLMGPVIAALSLQLVGRGALGERLGRNARYAAIGSGVAAAAMGALGTYWDEASVFYLTALLMVPALLSLRAVRVPPRPFVRAPGAPRVAWRVLLQPSLLLFAAGIALFHLGNAAMLPLVGVAITRASGSQASLIIAACIVLPQALVAVLSPWVGHLADRWGRRPVLLLAFAALPVRAVLFSVVQAPVPVVLTQLLDGISAAGLGVLVPLTAAELTRGTNHFNLVIGLLGLAAGAGATLSTVAAGALADAYGLRTALLCLAGAGLAATLLALLPGRAPDLVAAP